MLALAIEGIGIAVLPNYLIADALLAKQVIGVGPSAGKGGRRASNTIYLAVRRGSAASARLRAVQEALLSAEV